MKITLLSLLVLAAVSTKAQNLPQTFKLADSPCYSEKNGYGFDRVDTTPKDSKAPFLFLCTCSGWKLSCHGTFGK